MAVTAHGARVSPAGMRLAAAHALRSLGETLARAGLLAPVLVAGLALAGLSVEQLGHDGGSLAGIVQFGRAFASLTHPPAGVPLFPSGYDGQFYWVFAHDPLLLHHSTLVGMSRFSPGLQRVAYPALAYGLALGRAGALPATLLAVNVLAVLGLTAVVAAYARRHGRSTWWGLAVGLTPGLLMPVLRDLSDPLAAAALLGGIIAWETGRRWLAGTLLAVAALTREPMILAPLAIAAETALALWRARGDRPALRALLRGAWPAVALPVVAFAIWQIYIRIRFTGVAGPSAGGVATTPNLHPFSDFTLELRRTLAQDSGLLPLFDIASLAILLAGMGCSALLAVRRPGAATLTALGSSLLLTIVLFGDVWGVVRYSLPVLGLLVVAGLRHRARVPLLLAVCACALVPFVPAIVAGTGRSLLSAPAVRTAAGTPR